MSTFRNKSSATMLFIMSSLLAFSDAMSSVLVDTFSANDQYDYANSTSVNQTEVALFQRFVVIEKPMFFDKITLAASHVSGPNDVFLDIYQGSIQPSTLVATFHLMDELPPISATVPSPLPKPTVITVLNNIFFDLELTGSIIELLVLMRPGDIDTDVVWHHSLNPLDPVSLEAIRISTRPISVPSTLLLVLVSIFGLYIFRSRRLPQ